MPTITLPGVLRQYSEGRASVPLDCPDGAELTTVLDALDAACPRLAQRVRDERGALRRYVNVYVDGEDVRSLGGVRAPVPAGAEVLVLPSVAGG